MNTQNETQFAPAIDSAVRTILFDFDGTLVFHEPDSFDLIRSYCIDIGQPLSAEAERRGRRTRHEYFVDPIIRDQISDLPPGGFWQHFNRHLLEALGIEGDLDQLATEVTARFARHELTYHCPPVGCDTLTRLQALKYRLGLITNRTNVERFYELLDAMELRCYFDLTLASGEVGVRKPEPEIFYTALERLETQAEESIYIGDNYWADVVGARRAGITPVLFDPYRLFPEAECLVLEDMDAILSWLPSRQT
jgi:FMN phosphatase YigB (HAD superfamily)